MTVITAHFPAKQVVDEDTRRSAAAMQAQQQQFNHQQAMRRQMHEQFLATMQWGTDISMAQTQASMFARTTAASDRVDYALDPGQVNKVSSDVNANPNGVLQGAWTKQQAVHGNGTP
jgi:hypothetical protein